MRAGPIDGTDARHLPERNASSTRPSAPSTTSGSDSRSATTRARRGRQPHRHVARLARRIDPVADVDAGKRRPQRLRHLADRHAERAGQAAIDLDVQLRLLALVDRPTSTAPGTCPTSAATASASLATARARRVPQLQLNLLLASLKPVLIDAVDAGQLPARGGSRRRRRPGCASARPWAMSLTNTVPSSTASPCAADACV